MQSILIVGAGFSGAVIARELAEAGYMVTVIDKRDHIGGNAYDYVNEVGIRIHKYGPHLFHTSNEKVVEWITKFTKWVPYKHKVKAMLADGRLVTLPVNDETSKIVGKENIVDIFFRPYTKKMWDVNLEDLDPEILNRVAVRSDLNEYYFPNDSFQAMPEFGYERMFQEIMRHPNISIKLNTAFASGMDREYFHTFNSMPIDEYFEFRYGALPYRSIKFHTYTLPLPNIYPVAVVNFTHSEPYTRVTEWKNIPSHGNSNSHTTITIEEPCDYAENNFERYYPVKDLNGENAEIYKRYRQDVPKSMTFIGRCGLYAYLDMHQAISVALSMAKKFLQKEKE